MGQERKETFERAGNEWVFAVAAGGRGLSRIKRCRPSQNVRASASWRAFEFSLSRF